MIFKQSSAATIKILLYDLSDFLTPITGVVFGDVTCYYSKEGGVEVEKTVLTGDWTEIGHGHYGLDFTGDELDTLGEFAFQVTDGQSAFLDYNGKVMIETGTNTDIEAKIDLLPGGTGTSDMIIHCATAGAVDIEGVTISRHNAANDDSPGTRAGAVTDASGNASIRLIDGSYTLRAVKAGWSFPNITPTVSGSATLEMVGTAVAIAPPVSAETSTVYISAIDANGVVITTGLALSCATSQDLTLDDNGNHVSNDPVTMTYDVGSETWQAELIRNVWYELTSDKMFSTDSAGALRAYRFKVLDANTTNLETIII